MGTTSIYPAMQEFTNIRAEARDAYLAVMKEIRDAEGTKYYRDRERAAAEKRRDTVNAAKQACQKILNEEFADMKKRNRSRKMASPSEEQLRLLQMLSMRENVTESELQAAANAMQGNGAGLGMIHELARKHHILLDFSQYANEYDIAQAEEAIDALARRCQKVLQTGAKYSSYAAAKWHHDHYKTPINEDDLPQQAPFDSEFAFERFMGYGDRLKIAIGGT